MNLKLSYIIIAGLLLYILFLQQCGGGGCNKPKDNTLDTITTIEIEYDTIWPPPKIIEVPVEVRVPVFTERIDTVVADSICQFVRTYSDSLPDSNLVIYYSDTVQGLLLGKDLSYRLKIPTTIKETITVTREVPKLVKSPVSGLYLGLEAGGNLSLFNNISGALTLATKKGYSYSYRYNILQKTHNLQFGYRLLPLRTR